ncbi:hypothetical protein QBL02_13085 [Leucobacter sp. UT-8R-CII-1-4]|uniref:hypothetical protein n=1 Tax=Leucobacter sp. UT-8R-CII-1-4 TaxID=3040075 RepID=UPI0024A7F758|nr:hypothetical protein [Leucobacter sp. UT-8R-CII-1-4]MDI6024475.1 hypothetical protein [Leucobacter sp. UT-8R-CII-1-4]
MTKKLLAVAFISLIALTGCTAPASESSAGNTESPAEEAQPITVNLDGEWEQSNKNDENNYQAATIQDGAITVNWVAPDAKSIYWVGNAPVTADSENFTWTSEGDIETMSTALLASQDSTKEFSYDNGVISYEVTAMGTTITVRLEKK